MRNYFISIEIDLEIDGAKVYYTRLANEVALEELKKTKVCASVGGYGSKNEPFNGVACVTEITDDEIEILKKCGVDHISVGSLMLVDENSIESKLPYEDYNDADTLLNYVKD